MRKLVGLSTLCYKCANVNQLPARAQQNIADKGSPLHRWIVISNQSMLKIRLHAPRTRGLNFG